MSILTFFTGSVPANYDKYLGPILFEPYALDLIERLQNDKVKNVLELACGTGRVTNHLVKLIPDDGQLIATDLNADMIDTAKKIVSGKVQWQVADAQNLPFMDKTFDHVVCQYGVMFFPNKQVAFHEAYRVLQIGGKFLFSTWDDQKYNPGIDYMKNKMEEVLKDDAPDFFNKGPYSFYDKEEIKSLLEGAGFKNIQIELVNKTSTADPKDFITGFINGSPLSAYLNNSDASVRENLEQELIKGFEKEFGAHDVPFHLQALVCSGVR